MKKKLIIHPFLFAIFPILFLYSYNIGQLSLVSYAEILIPIAIMLAFTSIALIFLWLILKKNSDKAGIILTIFLILFFSYGRIIDLIKNKQLGGFKYFRHRYFLIVWLVVFILLAFFVIKARINLYNFTKILNFIAVTLIIISLVNIGVYLFRNRSINEQNKVIQNSTLESIGSQKGNPDIYYIILDMYASSRTLKEVFDYDNNEFIDYLSKRGFYIAENSQSNYTNTHLSLASSLNMKYINYLSDTLGVKSKDYSALVQMIRNNEVVNFLKSKGYKYINFGCAWFPPTSDNPNADFKFSGKFSEFQRKLIQTSMLGPIADKYIFIASRQHMLSTFSGIANLQDIKGSKFIFAHIIAPHPPFLFGANGEEIIGAEASMQDDWKVYWVDKEKYINQLIFVNKKVEIMVDNIISKSEIPPIIIIQGDHGTPYTFLKVDIKNEKYNNLTEEMLRERMGILSAYFLPSGGNDILYDSITPVNSFRLIFNYYFNAEYEILDDHSYFSEDDWYDFIDINDLIK